MTVPQLRHPIVMVHGLMGLGRLHSDGSTKRGYWANVPAVLTAAGNSVLVPRLPAASSVATRAAALKEFLDHELPQGQFHLLAHSMGGLDSRYLISRLDMAERVLTLTTLGTPHRGTAFADWGVRVVEPLVKPMLDFLGLPYEAFRDLTTAGCAQFNEQTPDAPNVRYFSVAGQFTLDWKLFVWRLSHPIIEREEGPNDGLVSVASAQWGETFEVWEADHASLINRSVPACRDRWPDRISQYATLLGRLAAVEGAC